MKNATEMGRLTRGQAWVLAAATLPMMAAGVAGGLGTYSNVAAEFGRGETAIGVVAAGEGVTLVLALVMVGLTMLGQAAPLAVRAGLWAAPIAAALIGVSVADGPTEMVVYGLTPMGMCASAEGLGLLARRIVVHRTGVDMEARRRNAATVQLLAYHRARAANHPTAGARKRSERASWRLAKRVGVGDEQLGADLVTVQRERLRDGADASLAGMFGAAAPAPVLPPVVESQPEVAVERADDGPHPVVIPPVTGLPVPPVMWEQFDDRQQAPQDARALAAGKPRQVVTETVTRTPAELRREARKLHRRAVRSTKRPVTIRTLQDELGLSRREATELRREVVKGVAS